ncbi:DUF935 family protein [Desulfobulbus sp.]|uniref:DUF935 domain-containing protein n=1 Tax=Desulfobulbus sp. TaxID=895 RepID=UPI00286EE1E4|nr:DUF935 family protein [Desulfobulbus sp.]
MPKDLRREIATIASDPAIPAFAGVLRNEDDTLLSRGGGKGLKIYDEIERDCHAYSVLQKRKNAIIAREWQVEPASSSRQDKKAADLVKAQLTNIKFDQVCLKLLDATLKGYSVGEIMWTTDGAEIVAAKIKVKPQRRFLFDEEQLPRLITLANMFPGEPVPARKFIVHRYGEKDDDNPYGLGLGHKLFWPVFFKRQDITFWLTFVDKFASPTAIGEYPSGTSDEEQKKLLASLNAIAHEAGIIVPQGMVVKFLEAARSGSIDTYEKLARYMDEQISECVLGETLSTNIGNTGSMAAAKTHNEVRIELAKGDSDLLSDTINETLARWIVELNLPGAGPPKVWRDFAEEEDLKARSETDKNLYDMGFEPDEQYINETYGGKWRRKAPEEQPAPDPTGEQPAAQFAEQSPDTVDQLAGRVMAEADGADMVETVYRLLAECGSLEEVQQRLLDIYDQVPVAPTGTALGNRLFQAGLAGRAEVLDEAGR